MNETYEMPKEVIEQLGLSDMQATKEEFDELNDVWSDFITITRDFIETLSEDQDTKPEIVEARDYGIKECSDVAKECFTVDVIKEWGMLDLEARDKIIQEYSKGIGEALGIDFKGIVWDQFPCENGEYTYGYNAGDGFVHLNVDMLIDPGKLMFLIDTVAHEARHQFQREAIENPNKFPIDEATIKEWTVGVQTYTLDMPSAYDPWGYVYNPLETDASYFGGAMVRELTKDIINNA